MDHNEELWPKIEEVLQKIEDWSKIDLDNLKSSEEEIFFDQLKVIFVEKEDKPTKQ